MEQEIWKDIEGYEGLYQVSNFGRIKSLERFRLNGINKGFIQPTKILKQLTDTSGYFFVILYPYRKHLRVNRIVAIAFIPNPENKKEVNHINGIKSDNRVENLEWCTPSENCKHAFKIGHSKQYGTFNSNCKLSDSQVDEIRHKFKNELYSKLELATFYNVSDTQISNIVLYKQRNKKVKN